MYCKKCGVNYKKDKKICPRCGQALQKGKSRQDESSRIKKIAVIACAAAALVVAFFLVIFFIGRIPPKLMGTWYEVGGYGYLEFKPNGVVTLTSSGYSKDCTYTFDNTKGEGTLTFNNEQDTLTCDGVTLHWGDTMLTKAYVEQINMGMNIEDAINSIK